MSYVRFFVAAVLLTAAAALGVAQAGVGYPLGQWATVAAFERDTGASITEYSEAPVLQAMVADGTLPAVADRLPLEPAVVAPAEAVGQYGGTWRRVATRPTDNRLADRMGYEPLLRRARDGTAVVANIAHRWEASPDGTQFTFHLREGMKWSDGAPFTADDIVFQFENVYSNEEVSPVFPSWLTVKTVPPTLTKVDDQTIVLTFSDTNGLFEEVLTFRGDGLFAPRHYLEQFHADFTDKDKLNEAAQAEGFELWHQRYGQLANVTLNQDLPTIRPWKLASEATGVTRQIAERNAFYWKVDTVGQQLPYIDRIAIDVVESGEAANFKAMAGEIDMQSRYMSFGNFTLFVENEAAEDYQVRQWVNPIPDALKFNLTYEDAVLRELFNERDFRIAMSKAIDRQEIGDLVYLGVATPWQAVPVEADPFFVPPVHTDYDPDGANKLLDGIGLTARDGDNMRLRPDGDELNLIISSYGAEEAGGGADMLELIKDHWEAVGIRTSISIEDRSLWSQRRASGEFMVNAYLTVGIHWSIDPNWYVPVSGSQHGWAPESARWYATNGEAGEEPTPEIKQLQEWYGQMQTTADPDERVAIGKQIIQSHVDNVWMIGTVRYPAVAIVKNNFRNVPETVIQSWRLKSPGYTNVEQYWIEG